mgnify:CR=1 FL=1
MVHEVQLGRRTRMSYSQISEVLDMPDLIEVQKNSYRRFVNEDLMEALRDASPAMPVGWTRRSGCCSMRGWIFPR